MKNLAVSFKVLLASRTANALKFLCVHRFPKQLSCIVFANIRYSSLYNRLIGFPLLDLMKINCLQFFYGISLHLLPKKSVN